MTEINSERNVAIFGLGFVGLPLALSFAMRGCNVIGVDVNEDLVAELNEGVTHHLEGYKDKPIQVILKEQLEAGRFRATSNPQVAMKECNNIIMTVGIPVIDGEHTFSHVESASKAISAGLKKGDLVLVRSTLIPGMTEGFVCPILEESGFKAGEDFLLGYSSERIAEGKAFDEFENMPTLASGINEASLSAAIDLLKVVTKAEVIAASQIKVVESAKVMENISRDVNIAMVNEFARFSESLGIDIFEVIKVANTHKRVDLLFPGPGVGGYCIPNALYYLLPKAEELGVSLDLLKTARRINDGVPNFIVEMIENNLLSVGKNLAGAKIAAFGFAMKDFSNDDRISPAINIIEILQSKGALVKGFDPAVPTPHTFKVDSMEEAVQDADVIVILTKQGDTDYYNFSLFKNLMNEKPIIIDTRNIYDRQLMEREGFIFDSI